MQSKSDIVVLSKRTDETDNLVFLLRLSNYKTTRIRDDIEAFNYLVQRQQGNRPASLLVIDKAEPQQQFLQLVDDLDRCGAMLPILLTHQEKPIAIEQLNCQEQLKKKIKQCHTDKTHNWVRDTLLQQLNSFPGFS